jgi:Aminoglycoside-2''-adenylyltransferase
MTFSQMLAVLNAVRSVGCRFWVEGGWGVDALVGHQTRPHRDVDLDIDGTFEDQVLGALQKLGYTIETGDRTAWNLGHRAADGSTCIPWCSTSKGTRDRQPSRAAGMSSVARASLSAASAR